MSAAANEVIFHRTSWVVVRPQRDSYLFYNSRTDELHLVPPTGHVVYELCDGLRTVDDIADHLAQALDVEPAILRERLSSFLGTLEARGLVERSDA